MSEKINKELIDSILSKEHPVELALDTNLKIIDNSIQVDKDEDINDFFVSWKKFNHRPSKISLFSQFDSVGIWTILQKDFQVEDSDVNKIAEIFPDNYGAVYNMKYFISISDDISLSFFEFDKDGDDDDGIEEIYSSNLTIYYNQKKVSSEEINAMLTIFQSSMIDMTPTECTHKTINTLHLNLNNTFELKPLEFNKVVTKRDLNSYYNKEVLEHANVSIERLNSNSRGLTILNGQRGTGKSTLLNYIIKQLDKKIIYVPSTVTEHTFNNIEFSNFLKANQNSVLVFDDCELFFGRNIQGNNLYTINLLQILDGITSDSLNTNFILCMNTDKDSIDTNLYNSNNFLSNIKFGKLGKNKATKLSKKLGNNVKYDNDVNINEVIRAKSDDKGSIYY